MLICPGDSITERRPWHAFGPVLNLGRGGDTCALLKARYAIVLDYAPMPVHLLIGTNNALDNPLTPALDDIMTMANWSRSAWSPVILCKIPPREFNVADFNDALVARAATEGFDTPVDYWSTMMVSGNMNFTLFNSDYTHPNASGWPVMDKELFAELDAREIWRPIG